MLKRLLSDPTTTADTFPEGWTDLGLLGRGPTGPTHRALDLDGRDVALKFVDVVEATAERERRRFVAQYDEPRGWPSRAHVAPPVAAGVTGSGRPWVATAFQAGASLGDRLAAAGPLPVSVVVRAGIEAANGLHEIHALGGIHGNVKSTNLMVDADGVLRLADIAVAGVVEAVPVNDAPAEALRHLAPEVLAGRPRTVQADVYALASTLFTLLAGRSPYERDAGLGAPQLLLRILAGPVPQVRRDDVPAGVLDALSMALAPVPGDRQPVAAAFARQLRSAAGIDGLPPVEGDVAPAPVQWAPPTVDPDRLATIWPTRPPPPTGRPLGSRYLLTEVIGRGAMGEVWRAVRRSDDTPVAVKVLRDELTENPAVVARFLQERTTLTGLVDDHLVRVQDMVAEGSTLGIVMDLIGGPDLRSYLCEHLTLAPATAADVVAQLASGLAAVHAAGVTHRDLKPENVLLEVEPGGRLFARLTDFGIARSASSPLFTRFDQIVGTAEYVAPEVVSGAPASPASDVYALGVMAYEALAGRRPFTGEHPAAVLQAHLHHQAVRPPGLPDAMWTELAACLAKHPERRPDAREVARAFQALVPALTGLAPLAPMEASATTAGSSPPGTPAVDESLGTSPGLAARRAQSSPVAPAVAPVASMSPEPTESIGPLADDGTLPTSTGMTVPAREAPTAAVHRRPRRLVLALVGVAVLGLVAGGAYRVTRHDRAAPRPPATTAPLVAYQVYLPTEVRRLSPTAVELRFDSAETRPGFRTYQVYRDGNPLQGIQVLTGASRVEVPATSTDQHCFAMVAIVVSATPLPPVKQEKCLAAGS